MHSRTLALSRKSDNNMELQKLFNMQELPESMVKAAAKLFQSGFKAGERLGQNLSDLIDVFIDSFNSNNKDYE